MWGAFPLYFPLLEPAGAFEILAHRIVWSAVVTGLLVLGLRRTSQVRAILADRRTFGFLALASVVITVNWTTYIWGVNHGHVVEASLGYFINPLVTVLLGVVVFRERLRPLQWAAVGVGAVAVLVLAVDYGRLPWIALVLAFSFGTYGLAKKQANTGAIESLTIETAILSPVALGLLVVLGLTGASHFTARGPGHALLFVAAGVITALPLLCFGAAATRVPLVQLGLLQYLGPILQLAIGILHFHEAMPTGRWIGFGLVWAALAVFTYDALTVRKMSRSMVVDLLD